MPNFKYSPHCILTTMAVLEPSLMAGNGIAMWSGKTGDGPIDVTAAELRERGHAISVTDAGHGFYALRDPEAPVLQFEVDWRNEVVNLSDGSSMAIDKFKEGAMRATPEGKMLCSFLISLHEQHRICVEAGNAASLHRPDIAAFAQRARGGEDYSSDAGMYDIVTSGMEDKLSDMEAMMAGGRRAVTETAPIFARIEEMGIPRQAWMQLAVSPQFAIAEVRALYRSLMEKYIGDTPIEDVSMIGVPDANMLTAVFDATADKLVIDEPFEGGNIMPGYKTTKVRHYYADGMEAIVFSDQMASYAYCWHAGPKPEIEPDNQMTNG